MKRSLPKRTTLLLVALVLLVAFAIRVTTFDRFTPYLDYTDETVYYGFAQDWRGLETVYLAEERYAAPPFYAAYAGSLLQLAEWVNLNPWRLPHRDMFILRGHAVLLGVLTTLVMIYAGWRLANPAVGLLCGVVWALSPSVIPINNLATPDSYVFFFFATALLTAFLAVQRVSPLLLLLSLLAGIGAIYSKYWIGTAVLPFCFAALYLLIRQPRRFAPYVPLYALIAGASAYYLLAVVNPLGLGQDAIEIERFRANGVAHATDITRNLVNWRTTVAPIGHIVFWFVILVGGARLLFFDNRQNKRLMIGIVAVLVVTALLTITAASTFTIVQTVKYNKIRHLFPAMMTLLLVWAICLDSIAWWIGARHSRWMYGAVATVLIVSYIPGNVQTVRYFEQDHIAKHVWQYSDSSLPNDGLVLFTQASEFLALWNRPWNGYPGDKPMDWFIETPEQIASQSHGQLIERGFSYFVLSKEDYNRFEQRGLGQDLQRLLNDMLLIKSFDPERVGVVGNPVDIYRVKPPDISVDVQLGDHIRFLGYDLDVQANAVHFRPYWQTNGQPKANYSIFVHLYQDDATDILAQVDRAPIDRDRLTMQWDDDTEIYVGEMSAISVPSNVRQNRTWLAVGLYNPETGVRLAVANSEQNYVAIPLPATDPSQEAVQGQVILNHSTFR
jgi:hypothetical protein